MEEMQKELQRGTLDKNPRLWRRVTCRKCGRTGKRLIDFLKEGLFVVGKTEKITVTQPGLYVLFRSEEETATPILIKTVCANCGNEEVISDPVLTVEYLTGICKCGKPRITYV